MPAVVFGAIAGVFVDRFDRRWILVGTNVARGALFAGLAFVPDNLVAIYLVTAIVATLTTFFAPAEAAMIPLVVKNDQLMTANGLFILALQASFVLGFAVLGPLAQNLVGTQWLIIIVAAAYGLAGLMCLVLPAAPPTEERSRTLRSAGSAVATTMSQLREGIGYIRRHRNIVWSLTYLAVTSSLIGVVGVLGPDFAVSVLGLEEDDFVIVVLPLGVGLVVGILVLNLYGRLVSRRRLIEGGHGRARDRRWSSSASRSGSTTSTTARARCRSSRSSSSSRSRRASATPSSPCRRRPRSRRSCRPTSAAACSAC